MLPGSLLSSFALVAGSLSVVNAGLNTCSGDVCSSSQCTDAFKAHGEEASAICAAVKLQSGPNHPNFPSWVQLKCKGPTLSRVQKACACLELGGGTILSSKVTQVSSTAAPTWVNSSASTLDSISTSISTSASTSTSISTSDSTSTSTLASISTSTTSTPTPSSPPSTCSNGERNGLILVGADEKAFNPANTPFFIKPSCGELNVMNYAVFLQDANTGGDPLGTPILDTANSTTGGIELPGFPPGFVTIAVVALDNSGFPMLQKFSLLFGTITMPVTVVDENGQPVVGIEVEAVANAYPGVRSVAVSDASGVATFTSLFDTSIGLFARTDDNRIAVNGIAATSSNVELRLLPFLPIGDTDFGIDNGTTGWTGVEIASEPTGGLSKRATVLRVVTSGEGLRLAHASPRLYPFTKTVFIRYKFQTDEVPGGYYGTQYNDYYIVAIRSNAGDFVRDSKSMNELGLGSFDGSGATDWFELHMSTNPAAESVQFDVGVANVADGLFDSQVIIGGIGDLTCEECGSCETCPGNPVCQPTCQSPTPRSCDFYTSCAEATVRCGAAGYPLGYGARNCLKFQSNLSAFSSAGQDWIWNVMLCLQRALVTPLMGCDASCQSIYNTAFASHPSCYVESGVCFLSPSDLLQLVLTVGNDLFMGPALQQAVDTTEGCAGKYADAVGEVLDDLKSGVIDAATNAKIIVWEGLRDFFNSF